MERHLPDGPDPAPPSTPPPCVAQNCPAPHVAPKHEGLPETHEIPPSASTGVASTGPTSGISARLGGRSIAVGGALAVRVTLAREAASSKRRRRAGAAGAAGVVPANGSRDVLIVLRERSHTDDRIRTRPTRNANRAFADHRAVRGSGARLVVVGSQDGGATGWLIVASCVRQGPTACLIRTGAASRVRQEQGQHRSEAERESDLTGHTARLSRLRAQPPGRVLVANPNSVCAESCRH